MGGPVKKPVRVLTGVATGGLSEVARTGVNAVVPKVPDIPSPARPAEAPEDATAPVRGNKRVRQAAIRRAQLAAANAGSGGEQSTIATGPQGLIKPARTTKTLLGV